VTPWGKKALPVVSEHAIDRLRERVGAPDLDMLGATFLIRNAYENAARRDELVPHVLADQFLARIVVRGVEAWVVFRSDANDRRRPCAVTVLLERHLEELAADAVAAAGGKVAG
jgi:hypothetical protein